MKGHTQETQQRGLLFTIHHEFQVKTKFSHHFRHQMHVPGGTNDPGPLSWVVTFTSGERPPDTLPGPGSEHQLIWLELGNKALQKGWE